MDPEHAASAKKRSAGVRTGLVCVLAGLLIGVAASTSQGIDLRPDHTARLDELALEAEQNNREMRAEADQVRAEIDVLAAAGAPEAPAQPDQELVAAAQMTAVKGPAVRVVLTDAPLDVAPVGVDEDLLVVHQQDIQVVVNALWAGGAEAMTIQGQRVITTTAIKCVGNTVVLHGQPYAPPYEIVAIGDQQSLEASLAADRGVQIYKQYARKYQLGYDQARLSEVTMPAYSAGKALQYARPK